MADKGLKYVGTNPIKGVALGSQEGHKLYLGETLVWDKGYSVVCHLTNITTNAPSNVSTNGSLTATLTPTTDYRIQNGSVVITMGGTDITSTAYDSTNNTITIASVTGDVSITAVAMPYDAEVEYIESDGLAYINLQMPLNSATDVIDIDFMPTEQASSTKFIFGNRASASGNNFTVLLSSVNSIVVDVNNGSYATYRIMSSSSAVNVRCFVHAERSNKYIKYDGVQVASSTTTSQSFKTTGNACICTTENSGTFAKIKIYSLQWHRNGDLLFDLVPVRKDGVGYLYDKVGGNLFGNSASSGAFTYGNDKT